MRLALLLLAACETLESPTQDPPLPPPGPNKLVQPAPRRPRKISHRQHVIARDAISIWTPKLPRRGVFVTKMGTGGSEWILLDAEARTTEHHAYFFYVKSPPVKKATLTLEKADKLWRLAEATWQDDAVDHDVFSDFRAVIVVVDGDEALEISMQGFAHLDEPAHALMRDLGWAAGLKEW